ALGPGQAGLELRERVEDRVEAVGRDPHAVVLHPKDGLAAVDAERETNAAARRRVLARVAEQVADDLLQPGRIAADGHRLARHSHVQRLALGVHAVALRLDGEVDGHPQVETLGTQIYASA